MRDAEDLSFGQMLAISIIVLAFALAYASSKAEAPNTCPEGEVCGD